MPIFMPPALKLHCLPAFFHIFICLGRMRILLLERTEYFQVWHQTKGNIAVYTMIPVARR